VVTKVIDGDTIEINSTSGATRVRLIGIDAPEQDTPGGSPASHWADRSTAYLRARLEGKRALFLLEPTQTRDRWGRLLAYVYLSDSDLLNLDIVRDGQAYADRRFKHTFRPQFEMAENEARNKKRGLWKDVTEDQMPEWRKKWLREVQVSR
jgi:micrococcal nuclease